MKHLLLTTALITAGAAGSVYAESHASKTDETAMSGQEHSTFMAAEGEGQIRASDFIGMRVYAAADTGDMMEADGMGDNWEDIGEINDVVMSRDGQIEAVLVDIGGFLGIGERQVAANMDQVKFVSDSSTEDADDFFLVLNTDPSTLGDAPEYSFDQAAAAVGTAMDDAGTAMANAADTAGAKIEEGADKVMQSAENAGDKIAEESKDMAAAAEETGDKVANETREMASDTAEAVDGDTQMSADASAAAEATTSPMAGTPVADTYLTAENLEGARVYDSNDKWVGEISELVISDQGNITDAIVDVGGFLGIGEKPVALKLSDLQILQQDGSDDVRIYTAMAESDLKALPEFNKE